MSSRSKMVLKRPGCIVTAPTDDANEQWATRVLSQAGATVCRSQSLLSPLTSYTRKDPAQIRRSSSLGSAKRLPSRSPSPKVESLHSTPSKPSEHRSLQGPQSRLSRQAQRGEGEKSCGLQQLSMTRCGHTVVRPSSAPSRQSDSLPEKAKGLVKPITGVRRNIPGNIPGIESTNTAVRRSTVPSRRSDSLQHLRVKMQLMIDDAKLPGIMLKQEHRLMVMTGQQRNGPRPSSAFAGEHHSSDVQSIVNELSNKKQTFSTASIQLGNMHPNVNTHATKLVGMKPFVPGSPTTKEVLDRGHSGWFGWSQAERLRVKRAFTRYSLPGQQEVARESLSDVILHLGYFLFSEGIVDELAQKVSSEQEFNMSDVAAVVENFAERERAEIVAAISALDDISVESDGDFQLDRKKVIGLLHNLGAYPLQDTISEVFDMARIASSQNTIGIEDVVNILAAYRAVEGLSNADIHRIKIIFERHAVKNVYGVEDKYEIPFHQLTQVLLETQNRHALDGIRSLLQKVPSYSSRFKGFLGTQYTSCPPGVTLHELCVWARRVRDFAIEHLLDGFSVGDLDDADCVSSEELGTLIQNEGFTLLRPAVDEFLAEANFEPHTTLHANKEYADDLTDCDDEAKPDLSQSVLNFSNYVKFVTVCQTHEGFREHQRNEFRAIFSKYDHNQSGSLNRSTICDLLTYFYGCGIHVQEINRAIDEVDFDLNGTMEFNEFLALMRTFAEMEYQRARVAFDMHSDSVTDMLPASHIVKSLGSMGVTLVPSVRESLEEEIKEEINLEMFWDVVERYRKLNVIELRKQASFSNEEFAYMRTRFNECRSPNSECLDEGRLLWLVMSLGYPCHTADQRKDVVGMIHKAGAQALAAGCYSGETAQSGRINFLCFVHLIRLLVAKQESSRETYEDIAIKETEFSVSDVIEFRKIFTEWTRSSKLQSTQAVPSNVDSACGKTTAEQLAAISPILARTRGAPRSTLPATQRRKSSSNVKGSRSENLQNWRGSLASVGDACQPILASADEPAVRLKAQLSCTGEQLPAEYLVKYLHNSGLGYLKDIDWQKICDYIGGYSVSLDFAAFLRFMRWMVNRGIGAVITQTSKPK